MPQVLLPAGPDDLEALLPFMRAYAEFDGLEFDTARARSAMGDLLADPRLGRVAFIRGGDRRCGYLALCYGYSLEFGGRDGFVDELFIDPAFRNRGLGSQALTAACDLARADGVRVLYLEVRRDNLAAQRYYERLGFGARARYLILTRELAPKD